MKFLGLEIFLVLGGACQQNFALPLGNSFFEDSFEEIEGVMSHLEKFGQDLFKFPDNETGLKVANWKISTGVNPEELGNYVEGDILFPPQFSRSALKSEAAKWPNGIVPYLISPYFDEKQRRFIEAAMDDYHRLTCIRFKPYTGEETDYIRITAGETGCWSSIGRIGGRQDMNLQVPGCLQQKGTVLHELLHVLGFIHEQSRSDRDDYVKILYNNIGTAHQHNFLKAASGTTNDFGVGYDYGSVMHYSKMAFSKNGKPTILPVTDTSISMGQREGFSKRDLQKIRRMYSCAGRTKKYKLF